MLVERIFFNLITIVLFIYFINRFLKTIKPKYVWVIFFHAFGMTVNLLELYNNVSVTYPLKIFTIFSSLIMPAIMYYLDRINFNFTESYLMHKAGKVYKSKDYKEARKLYRKIARSYPQNYMVHVKLANIYELEDKKTMAVNEYVKVVEIKPDEYDAKYKIAEILDQLDNTKEAKEILEKILKVRPDHVKASILLACIYTKQLEYDRAKDIYEACLKFMPDNFDILYNLGDLYLTRGDLKMAEEHFKLALLATNKKAECYYMLGRIYLVKGEREKAIETLKKSIEHNAEYAEKIEKNIVFKDVKNEILV